MDHTYALPNDKVENDILECIVDAMLEVEVELKRADAQQWQQILAAACRRRKGAQASDRQNEPASQLAYCDAAAGGALATC